MSKVLMSNDKSDLKKEAVSDIFDSEPEQNKENPETVETDVKPFIFCNISKQEKFENDEITEIKPTIPYDVCEEKESFNNEFSGEEIKNYNKEILIENINKTANWVAGNSTVLCEVRPIGILTTLLPNCKSHSFQTTNLSSESQQLHHGSHTSNALVLGFQNQNRVKYCFIKSEDIINAGTIFCLNFVLTIRHCIYKILHKIMVIFIKHL